MDSSFFTPRNRIRRDAALSRAKPSASSGASALRTGRICTADPSRSTTILPSGARTGRRTAASPAGAVGQPGQQLGAQSP
ncbi:MAG TPA: hypothetical protein VE888_05140, partial [Streptosporangiaceae bacterium]|nr:hypothetical protein [Streptosporangiaceae bacterium]